MQIQNALLPNPRYSQWKTRYITFHVLILTILHSGGSIRFHFYIFRIISKHDSSRQGWNCPSWDAFCKNGQKNININSIISISRQLAKRCIQLTHIFTGLRNKNIKCWIMKQWPNKTAQWSSDFHEKFMLRHGNNHNEN